jgi:putative GTP pyrophosphokinase
MTEAVDAPVDELLAAYDDALERVTLFRNQLVAALNGSVELAPHIHSIRTRLKEREHLRGKIHRKLAKCEAESIPFSITPQNLLTEVNDLVGVRILHLHTHQIRDIDTILRAIFDEQTYELREQPFARTWDDETREFFKAIGIETQESPTLYTSVHYVIGSASRTTVTAEIQVRTLSEEVWSEVDHAINYPEPTTSLACREQLKVLARATSTATRLVDAIFLTHRDETEPKAPA